MTNLEICGLPHTVEICDCLFSSNATTAADDMKNLHKTPLGWTSQPILVTKCSATFSLLISFFYSYNKKKKQNDMKNLHKKPLGWTSQPNLVTKCCATFFIDKFLLFLRIKRNSLTTSNKIVWSRIILCKNRKKHLSQKFYILLIWNSHPQ